MEIHTNKAGEKTDRKRFGKNVRAARDEAGLKGEKLAEICGISHSYMQGIERGLRLPALPKYIKLSNALGVPPGYLLRGLAGTAEKEECEREAAKRWIDELKINEVRALIEIMNTVVRHMK